MLMSAFTTHVSNGFFWRSDRHRPSFFTFKCDMQVTPSLYDTLIFLNSRPIINYWFFNDYRRECQWLDTRLCAISHSIADCLYLLVFEIDYSLPLIIKEKRREGERGRTLVYAPLNLIWTFWRIWNERSKIAAGTSYTYVCASLFSFELFLSTLTRVKETREEEK
jgi:hypothetical protein